MALSPSLDRTSEFAIVWCDRIKRSRFEDANHMFVPPKWHNLRVRLEGEVEYWLEEIARQVRPIFDSRKPTALFIGRRQPLHDGHKTLILEGLKRVGQVCIAVCDTLDTDAKNPLPFSEGRARIVHALMENGGRVEIIQVPNISHVFYDRDAGYVVECIDLDDPTEAISTTELHRHRRGANPSASTAVAPSSGRPRYGECIACSIRLLLPRFRASAASPPASVEWP